MTSPNMPSATETHPGEYDSRELNTKILATTDDKLDAILDTMMISMCGCGSKAVQSKTDSDTVFEEENGSVPCSIDIKTCKGDSIIPINSGKLEAARKWRKHLDQVENRLLQFEKEINEHETNLASTLNSCEVLLEKLGSIPVLSQCSSNQEKQDGEDDHDTNPEFDPSLQLELYLDPDLNVSELTLGPLEENKLPMPAHASAPVNACLMSLELTDAETLLPDSSIKLTPDLLDGDNVKVTIGTDADDDDVVTRVPPVTQSQTQMTDTEETVLEIWKNRKETDEAESTMQNQNSRQRHKRSGSGSFRIFTPDAFGIEPTNLNLTVPETSELGGGENHCLLEKDEGPMLCECCGSLFTNAQDFQTHVEKCG